MERNIDLPLSRQICSNLSIWSHALISGVSIFALAVFFQWVIYDDWMHRTDPIRLVGSIVAGGPKSWVSLRLQLGSRQRRVEMLRRFETIKWMNDRIRNSLQAIECVTYASNPEATYSVRDAVDAIEQVLQEVLVETHPSKPPFASKRFAEKQSIELGE